MFRNAFFICVLLIPVSMASHYAMAADSCQPVFDAITKIVTLFHGSLEWQGTQHGDHLCARKELHDRERQVDAEPRNPE